jgi:hypothetical protein
MIELLDGVYCGRKCCGLHVMISVMCFVLQWSAHIGVVVTRGAGTPDHQCVPVVHVFEGSIPTSYTHVLYAIRVLYVIRPPY